MVPSLGPVAVAIPLMLSRRESRLPYSVVPASFIPVVVNEDGEDEDTTRPFSAISIYMPCQPITSKPLGFLGPEILSAPVLLSESTSSLAALSLAQQSENVLCNLLDIPIEIRYHCYEYLLGDHRVIEMDRTPVTDSENMCILSCPSYRKPASNWKSRLQRGGGTSLS